MHPPPQYVGPHRGTYVCRRCCQHGTPAREKRRQRRDPRRCRTLLQHAATGCPTRVPHLPVKIPAPCSAPLAVCVTQGRRVSARHLSSRRLRRQKMQPRSTQMGCRGALFAGCFFWFGCIHKYSGAVLSVGISHSQGV